MAHPEQPLVVIPGDDPVQIGDSPQLDRLRARAEVKIYSDRPTSLSEQVQRVRGADVLLNSRGQLKWRQEALSELSDLKMITTCSIGTDSIDLEAARQNGIVVSNIPGKTAPVVAEHAIGLMFAIAKRAAFQTSELKAGRWTRAENTFLSGKTLGVIGTGAIGSEVIRLAKAIGMHVIAWTFHPTSARAEQLGIEFVEFDALLARSDVVSVHVKLTDESRGLLGSGQFQQMKPTALLVNTARGDVIQTEALVHALENGRLRGAALDVFDEEPLPAGHPILGCEQVVLTPHNADQTPEGIDLLNAGAVDNVLAFLDGAPQNVVN